jgi:hypothetical protein
VKAGADEAKFWLDSIAIAAYAGFRTHELNDIEKLIREHREEFLEAWNEHFS